MQKYELMILIWSNDHNEKSAMEAVKAVQSELETKWWEVTFDEFWWKRKIAYEIKHNNEGYYNVLNFNLDRKNIDDFESYLNLNSDVIRFLIVKVDENYKPFTKLELEENEKVRFKEKQEKKWKKRKPFVKTEINKDNRSNRNVISEVKKAPQEKLSINEIKDLDSKLDEIVKDI